MSKFINPFSDWGFKRIFGQEFGKDLLIGFLNELLRGEHLITDITFRDKEQLAMTKEERGIIYDIFCTTDSGTELIVEMQNQQQDYFLDRSLYYGARSLVKQGEQGKEWRYQLMPVYVVCFLNFVADADRLPPRFRSDVQLIERSSGQLFSDKLRLIHLMLPLFQKNEDECENDFERWIFILKNMEHLDNMPFETTSSLFQKLAEVADVSALSKEEREKYDYSLKILRDRYAVDQSLIRRGEARAIQRIARNMKHDGCDIAQIMAYTGLSREEIELLN